MTFPVGYDEQNLKDFDILTLSFFNFHLNDEERRGLMFHMVNESTFLF